MKKAYRRGALGALTGEYERFSSELKLLVEQTREDEFAEIIDTETRDEDCRSILTMAWQALNRWAITQSRGAMFAAVGAILFVASDSMIAFNRFFSAFRLAEFFILVTYFTAQWLIAASAQNGVAHAASLRQN